MLDVTDNELTVTVRVPEGRWLWLVRPRADVALVQRSSLKACHICGSQSVEEGTSNTRRFAHCLFPVPVGDPLPI